MATNFPDTSVNNPDTSAPWADGDIFDDTAESGLIYYWYDPVWKTKAEGDIAAGDLTVSSLNGGPLAGFRNQIINGDFRVWQRGEPVTIPGNGYGADRWAKVLATAGEGTFNRSLALFDGFPSACRFTATDVSTFRIRQPIELDYRGQRGRFVGTWTLSWYSNTEPATDVVFADDKERINSVTWTGGAIQSLGNNRFSQTFIAPGSIDATNRCVLVSFAPPSGTSWDLTGVQFEPGPVATPFEHRPIGTELALCQRYYQSYGTRYFTGSGNNSQQNTWEQSFGPPMRVDDPDVGLGGIIGGGNLVSSLVRDNALQLTYTFNAYFGIDSLTFNAEL